MNRIPTKTCLNLVSFQLKFNGHVSVNDVYPDIPLNDIQDDDEIEKSGPDTSTLKLLSQLAPVRLANKVPGHMEHQIGENYASGNQFKVKTESNNDQSNLPAIDDSDIPSIVSNFLDGHSVFSPQAGKHVKINEIRSYLVAIFCYWCYSLSTEPLGLLEGMTV